MQNNNGRPSAPSSSSTAGPSLLPPTSASSALAGVRSSRKMQRSGSDNSGSSSDTVDGENGVDGRRTPARAAGQPISVAEPAAASSSSSSSMPMSIPIKNSASYMAPSAYELSPHVELKSLEGDGLTERPAILRDSSSFYDMAGSLNDSVGGLQSFMSLNAPASPKRLSALEMTFPSLDSLGYGSDSDDEYSNVGTSNHMSGSPTEGGRPLEGRLRLSSFHEYGNRPAPTSLAVLSGLISGAAKMIDRAYHEQHVPVPDIDNPGITKSKFAKPAPELNVSPEIYKAIEVCIEACHQLVGIVQRPEVTIAEAAYAFEVSAALKVTTEAHVVEVLREEGPKGMNIARLAERVKMEPNFLLRVMRLLAAHNIFLEMGAGTQWFANNRVSLRLDSGEPLNNVLADPPTESPDGAKIEIRSMISHATDYTWHSASQMEERLRGKEIKYVKAEDENEKRARLYRQMNARKLGSHLGDPPSLLQVFRNIGNGLVVDLGSGLGRFLLEVARTCPQMRIELHDRKEVMELAEDMWYRLAPRSVVSKAVTFIPHDLISDQKYPRASTYLIRNHLVHWNDSDVLTILKKARATSFNSTKLYVEESTTDDELPADLSFLPEHVQHALLPIIDQVSHNADRVQHLLDVATLLGGSGRKRTMIELCLLLDQAGWVVNKIDNSSGGRCKIFFCRPKPAVKVDDD
ncbi:hypothetical protein EMMF5_005130 [Cystobasidiomycetes sp. EMM_F5]